MSWYRTGNVDVTNGDTHVVGHSTGWVGGNILQGYVFWGPDGRGYEIDDVVDGTHTGGSYAVQQVAASIEQSIFDRVAALITALESVIQPSQVLISTPSDTTSKLSVGASPVNFEGGTNIIVKMSKGSSGDDSYLEYQVAGSGRTRVGSFASNAWRVKYSSDGSTWNEALNVANSDGTITLLTPLVGTLLTLSNAAVIDLNQSADGLRVTQRGTGNVVLFEDAANPDASPFVITNGGRVVQGNPAGVGNGFDQLDMQTHGFGSTSGLFMAQWTTGTLSSKLSFGKSRGGAVNVHAALNNNDIMGEILVVGSDGGKFVKGARLLFEADAATGTDDMPTRMRLLLTPNASDTPVEVLRVTDSGKMGVLNASPAEVLDVTGNIKASGQVIAGLPVKLPSYTISGLPSAGTYTRSILYVSDGAGNKRLAISDGTNWRYPDGATV
jgi:hypothetical protein